MCMHILLLTLYHPLFVITSRELLLDVNSRLTAYLLDYLSLACDFCVWEAVGELINP